MQIQNSFKHYGVGHDGNPPGRGSGVLPWGYGKRPYQSLEGTAQYDKLMKQRRLTSGAAKTYSNPNSARMNIHETKKEQDARNRVQRNLARNIASARSGNKRAQQYLQNRQNNLNAVAKKINADDKRRSKLKIDKETGFHMRDKLAENREFKQAEWEAKMRYGNGLKINKDEHRLEVDSKHVNPGLSDFDPGTTQNCCLCTLTNEMRQRGYDVRAKKLTGGMSWEQIGAIFPGVKPSWIPQSMEKSPEWTAAKYGSNKAMNDRINKTIASQPEGSRGVVNFHRHDGSGHAISYEVKKGKPIYTDAQVGVVFDSSNSIYSFGEAVSCAFARLDNREPNLKRIREVCE